MNWGITPGPARERLSQGYLRAGRHLPQDPQPYVISYLTGGIIADIIDGKVVVSGRASDGSVLAHYQTGRNVMPTTNWNRPSHDAQRGGTQLLKALVPGRRFPFPKSLFAVEEAVRFFVKNNPDAVVLDFFAGSGTTAHAVARLNRQDSGRRQSIMVTNNEVSADEARGLRARGFRPGDPEWEALGIFEHITRPRVTAAITGVTPNGQPIKGEYKFTDEFPMADGFEENLVFLELRYLDPDDIDLGHSYDELAPLLWLRAGAQGGIARRADGDGAPLAFDWTDHYGVLFDEDHWRTFVAARPQTATAAFIATWSPATFAGIAAELPATMDVVRLYDTYLSQFLPERVGA
jgi:adenine-specific DNA-methyltransferase